MVISILRIKTSPADRAEVIKIIQPIIGPSEAQAACSLCRLYCETDDDDSLLFLQRWQSQKGLDKFIRSDFFKRIIAAMDLATQPPEISFNTVSSKAGMELIKELRLGTEVS